MTKLTDEQKKDNEKAFLKALTKLTKQYRISIGGCGCCGSPWINHEAKVRNDAQYTVDGTGLKFDNG